MTINQARKILGKEANNLSDEKIEKLLGQFFTLAELGVAHFQKMKDGQNYEKRIPRPLSG